MLCVWPTASKRTSVIQILMNPEENNRKSFVIIELLRVKYMTNFNLLTHGSSETRSNMQMRRSKVRVLTDKTNRFKI